MIVSMLDMAGKQVGEVDLNDSIFAAPVNESLMHQALVRQLANARLGTHKTKGRSEVRGGGRKPWRQKGTGRARQGSIRAPQWVGGGTVFGPQPRRYSKAMPKKMRRAALRSALSIKAGAGQIVVVDELAMDTPKTKAMIETLHALGIDENSVLMVVAEKNEPIQRSARNLQNDKRHKVKTLLAGYLNIRDILGFDTILLSKDAVDHIETWLAVDTYSSDEEEPIEADVSIENNGAQAAVAVAEAGSDAETATGEHEDTTEEEE